MKYKVFSIAFFFKWFPRKLFSFEISGWGNKLDALNFCVLIVNKRGKYSREKTIHGVTYRTISNQQFNAYRHSWQGL